MRDLIVSFTAIAVLISAWLLFSGYSGNRIESFASTIEDELVPLAEAENWSECIEVMEEFAASWQKYQKTALLFLDTDSVNEIDCSIIRSLKYVQARDVSNSTGELMAVCQQLRSLSFNEQVSIANIL